MKQGSSPNFKDLGSSGLPKTDKALGTRDDNRTSDNKAGEINTLTKTNKRTGKQKTRDISQGRADRIKKRQNKGKTSEKLKELEKVEVSKPESKKHFGAPKEGMRPKKSGPDWDKAPAVGSSERAAWYTENNLAQDKTTQLKKQKPSTPQSGDKAAGGKKGPDYSKPMTKEQLAEYNRNKPKEKPNNLTLN